MDSVELFQHPPPMFRTEGNGLQVILYSPRTFAQMTRDERVRACYQHTVLRFLEGDRMKNPSLCKRFGIASKNAAQAFVVISQAIERNLIRSADPSHPRAGYLPFWA
jgi:predicted HTH transcriptional regulator